MAVGSQVLVQLRLLGAQRFSAQARVAAGGLSTLGKSGTAAAAGMSRANTAMAAAGRAMVLVGKTSALVAGVGLYESTKAAISFDRSMRNVNSIAGLSEGQLGRVHQQLLKLAGPVAKTPKDLADGMYDVVQAGYSASEAMRIVGVAAKSASAGMTDTHTAAGAVVAVLQAYKRPARDAANVSDALFQTVNRGVITYEMLASNIGKVLPFAASLGVNLNQVGASISTLTKQGIDGESAITFLKNAMTAFLKPSKGLSAAIKATGAASGEALVKQKGWQGALEAVIGTTDGTRKSVAKLFPNIRQMSAVFALTGKNARGAEQDVKAFTDRAIKGATGKVFAEQMKSVSAQWDRLKAVASALAIRVGDKVLPVLFKALTKVTGLLRSGGFAKAVKGVIATVTGLVGRVVPAVKKLASEMLGAIKPMVPFLSNVLLPLLKGVGEGILVSVVGAIKVLIPIVKVVATGLGWLGEKAAPLKKVFEVIGTAIGVVFGGAILKAIQLAGKAGRVLEWLGAPVRFVGRLITGAAKIVGRLVRGFADGVTWVNRFAHMTRGGVARAVGAVTNLVAGIIGRLEALPGKAAGVAGDVISKIAGVLKGGVGSIAGAAAMMWDGLKGGLVSAINWIIGKLNWLIGRYNDVVGVIPFAGGLKIGTISPIGVPSAAANAVGAVQGRLAGVGGAGHVRGFGDQPGPPRARVARVVSRPLVNHVHVYVDGREVHGSVRRAERALLEAQ